MKKSKKQKNVENIVETARQLSQTMFVARLKTLINSGIEANEGNTDFRKTGEKDKYFQGVFKGRIEGLKMALQYVGYLDEQEARSEDES